MVDHQKPSKTVVTMVIISPGSESEFDCDLVYKFKTIMGRTDFSDQFRKKKYVTNVFNSAMI